MIFQDSSINKFPNIIKEIIQKSFPENEFFVRDVKWLVGEVTYLWGNVDSPWQLNAGVINKCNLSILKIKSPINCDDYNIWLERLYNNFPHLKRSIEK